MKTNSQIHQRQQDFLSLYNPTSSEEIALTSGLKASTQHNDLYSPGVNRYPIKEYWKTLLQNIGEKYRTLQSEETFFNDIVCIKNQMNNQFCDAFKNQRRKYEQGFRISHAQKSLSVYLKHLWCMNIIEQPPFCPIDSNVLRLANAPDVRWCHVNSMELYMTHVAAIRLGKEANPSYDGDSIAVWELFEF